jgi:hypothetical protein
MIKKFFDKQLGVGLSPEEKKYRGLSAMKRSRERDMKVKSFLKTAAKASPGKIIKSVVSKGLKKI